MLFFLWLFVASHTYLFYLPSTSPRILVLEGILKFPVGLLARGTPIRPVFSRICSYDISFFQVFLYSYFFPLDPYLLLDLLALGFLV